jgi:DNA-binding IscR family transcriptional regulator
VLESLPGPRGGFRLARPPESITLMDVVAAIDGPQEAFSLHRDPAARHG